MPVTATSCVLSATTTNTVKKSAGSTDNINKTATNMINNSPPAPLTKTQKAKLKKQEAAAKKERAKMIASQQKQESDRGTALPKISKPAIVFEKARFVIASDDSDDTSDTQNNDASSTTSSTSQTPTVLSTAPLLDPNDYGELSERAKMILAEKHKKDLVAKGISVDVLATGVPAVRKHVPKKKGRKALVKEAKVKRRVNNPVVGLVQRHKDDNEACKNTWQRIKQEHTVHVPRRAPAPSAQDASGVSMSSSLAALAAHHSNQDDNHDDLSDRAMTISDSDLDIGGFPDLVVYPANDGNDNLGEDGFADESSEFEENPNENMAATHDADALPETPRGDPQIQIMASTPVYNDEVCMQDSQNGFAVGDWGDSPSSRMYSYGTTKTADNVPQSEDVDSDYSKEIEQENITTPPVNGAVSAATTIEGVSSLPTASVPEKAVEKPDLPTELPIDNKDICEQGADVDETAASSFIDQDHAQSVEEITPEPTVMISPVSKVDHVTIITGAGMGHVARDDVAFSEPVARVAETPSWVSSLLSRPNARNHPPMLARDQKEALIAAHVAPLWFSVPKQKRSSDEKKATKALKVASLPPKTVGGCTQSPAPETTVAEEPLTIEKPLDININQAEADTVESTKDITSESVVEQTSEVASDHPLQLIATSSWISGLLSLPNAALCPPVLTRHQEHDLVTMHVTPLWFPSPKQKPSKAEKTAAKAMKSAAASNTAQGESPSSAFGDEPVMADMPTDDHSNQVQTETVLSSDNASLPAEDMAPAPIVAEPFKYVPGILSMPNGSGQAAADHALYEALIALHVTSLPEPPVSKKLFESIDDLPLHETVSAEVPASVQESPIFEVQLGDCDIVPASEEMLAVPTDKPLGHYLRIPYTSKSSKASSHRTSARSNNSLNNDIERKTHIARNTYLGCTSLEDFVNKLDFDQTDGTTTKTDICEAFAFFSADDTELIQGRRPADVPVNFNSAYARRRTKIGTTTLYSFLRGMQFDDEGVTTVGGVMRSFKKAAQQALQPSSKLATAFYLSPSEFDSISRSSRSRELSGLGSSSD